ncbi:helix-turn-helix domain-containing protein [Pusillimonas sp. ANT_WB101]|uniref:helix-turn-helix domain-containing protein n=1 Tax=Pusillimonas sp. ANT_WB101 TaxID=2597356 RepID=UPI0011EC1520|nr:XRE family transcriptional regulator [Pusillimonas sp. ANT_WB101]KAA0892573.1 XRE family transcriptional regulator [Pusillimonas sp. ANT_WB101]
MSKQKFDSVWDAIEDTPEEAENMKLRSNLMTALKNHLARTEISQAEAAKLLGVTQPRVSDLMRGKINLFGLDALVNMAAQFRPTHVNKPTQKPRASDPIDPR